MLYIYIYKQKCTYIIYIHVYIYIYQNNIIITHHFAICSPPSSPFCHRFFSAGAPWMTFAKPMSVSFTRPLSVSSRFSGFKSRKTILAELRYFWWEKTYLTTVRSISFYIYLYEEKYYIYIYDMWYTIAIGYIEYIYNINIIIHTYIHKETYTCGGWFGMPNDTENYTANRMCLFTSPFAIKNIWW